MWDKSVWGLTSIKPFHYHGIHIRLHGKKTLKSISLCLPLCSAGSCGGSTNNHLYQDQPLLTFCCILSGSQSCLNIIVLMLRAGFLFKLLHDLHHDTLLWLTEWGWSSAAVLQSVMITAEMMLQCESVPLWLLTIRHSCLSCNAAFKLLTFRVRIKLKMFWAVLTKPFIWNIFLWPYSTNSKSWVWFNLEIFESYGWREDCHDWRWHQQQ